MIRNLQTEQVKLQNICEKLLDGIVPPSLIDAMVEYPGGDLWAKKETQKAIRTRLWKSWDVFEGNLRDIQAATEGMYDKLGNANQTPWSDMTLAAKELKRVAFALNRAAYSEQLSTIRDGITNLESLATMSVDLEPTRRMRSRVKPLNVLRSVISSIYRAVESNLKCGREHHVLMELSGGIDRPSYSKEDAFMEDHQTDLLLAHHQSKDDKSQLLKIGSHEWEGRLLRVVPNLQSTAQISAKPAIPSSLRQKPRKSGRSVRFSMSRFASSTTITETTTSSISSGIASLSMGTVTAVTPHTQPCLDICSGATPSIGHICLGAITDRFAGQTRTYNVYSSAILSSEAQCLTVSLYDVLHSEDKYHLFTYRQRLQLAVFVATSVLHLYRTPWMSELPRSKSIVFVKTRDVVDYSKAFLKAEQTSQDDRSRNSMVQTPKLLPIGVLLVELIKGQRIESLRSAKEELGSESSALSDFMTARRLVDEICQASSTYGSAIRRCLDVGFKAQACDVQNEDFQHNFYSGIVALLEEDLNNL
ncbi:hypothetical protein FPOAC2_09737 [Fusarium poae]|uniref:hypothetical protein n=1 Tax=Fusarium poae TaxID=36050 RepID=UPI001CEB5673|nr:hypothetical protein FPOAC1_009791 [Fusarium poae]KAG8670382.1 hypothetical protein FPOAC1_009791 [Fusarium poae]